jgi:transcriptional regulator with XRE-family HTH domain
MGHAVNKVTLHSVGERLRAERMRLGYNTRDFAVIGGIGKGTQSRYERDETSPDAEYLNRIASVGAEIFWIMLGENEDLRDKRRALYPPEVRRLIDDYMLCPVAMQEYLRKTAEEAAKLHRERIAKYINTGVPCDDTHQNRDDNHATDAGDDRSATGDRSNTHGSPSHD